MDMLSHRRQRGPEMLQLKGVYRFKHWRDGKLIRDVTNHNTVTSEGKQYLLDVGLDNGTLFTAQPSWYVMLVSNDGPPNPPDITNTYANFAGTDVVEFTEYLGTERKAYNGGVLSVARITNNSSRAIFTFDNPTKDLLGAALVSSPTWNDATTGDVLMSWAELPGGWITPLHEDIMNIEIELAFM